MKRFYKKIDELKLNNDNTLVLFLQLLYRIFSSQVFLGILNVIIPFLFTLPIIKDESKLLLCGIICVILLIIVNTVGGIATGYKVYNLNSLNATKSIINNMNSLNKIYNERITDENGFQGLFELMSDSICSDLYHLFKVAFKIETRVSVIQQYPGDTEDDYYSMMISRASKNTQRLGRRRDTAKVQYTSRKSKYYKKILVDNNDKIVILLKDEILKNFIFSTKKNKNIQQYIAFPQKAYGKRIAFILQVDVMKKDGFGKSSEDIEKFCEEYVDPFIRILQNAYLIETIRGK